MTDRSIWEWSVRLLGAALFVSALVAGGLYVHYRSAMSAPRLETGESQTLTIPEGADWSRSVRILRRAGLVEYPLYFEIWSRRRGLPSRVRAGTYHFEGPLTVEQLAGALQSGGETQDVEVTFPEGWTIFHMADHLEEVQLVGRAGFLSAVRDDDLLERAGIEAESLEGYLFPDTYRFEQGAAPEEIVWKMFGTWRENWEELTAAHPDALARLDRRHGLDRHDIVTLASIVQTETRLAEERPIIARVMLNRLETSMKLQADPTCVYGPDTYGDVPSPEACRDPTNRYSTYVNAGLPPGPIGNPGRVSLEAVLAPAQGPEVSEYLFYCARRDGSGAHAFSSTYEEHRRAVDRYLK